MKIKFKSTLRSLGISESLIEKTADIDVSIGGLVEFLLAINFNNWEDLDKAIDENLVDNRINEINTKLDSAIKLLDKIGSYNNDNHVVTKYIMGPDDDLEDTVVVSESFIQKLKETDQRIKETCKTPYLDRYLTAKTDKSTNKPNKEKSKPSKSKPRRRFYAEMGPEIQEWIDANKPKSMTEIAKHFECATSTISKLLDTGVIKYTFPDTSNRRRKERFTDYVKFSDVENSRIHKIDEIIHDSGLINRKPNIFNKLYTRLRDTYGIVFEDNMKDLKYKYNLVPIEDYPNPSKFECIVCDDKVYDIAEALLYTICEEMTDKRYDSYISSDGTITK